MMMNNSDRIAKEEYSHAQADRITTSVIIPTYNRPTSLIHTLQSLSNQELSNQRFEVIVIDDGSEPRLVIPDHLLLNYKCHVIRQVNHGAAIARNRGVEQAVGENLIFLDDDIVVNPTFIQGMIERIDDHTLIVGCVQYITEKQVSPFGRIYATLLSTLPVDGVPGIQIPFTECLSGLFAMKRKQFIDLGEMQDVAGDGRVAWGDIDFAYRAFQKGFVFWRSYHAIGFHLDTSLKDMKTYNHRWEQTAFSAARLFCKYPELPMHFPLFRDKLPIAIQDTPELLARKIFRAITALRPINQAMEWLVPYLERFFPSSFVLRLMYRWINSTYVYRGYRRGLHMLKRGG
jgi:glycosyltransferase involved in cell wall biosynthesis